jgi:hypothetical protein
MQNIDINTIFGINTSGNKENPLSIKTMTDNIQKNFINSKSLSRIHNEKKKNNIKLYYKIYKQCLDQIKIANESFKYDIFFIIPDKINGVEKINKEECIDFLIKKIRKNNIDTLKITNDVLFITWINSISN